MTRQQRRAAERIAAKASASRRITVIATASSLAASPLLPPTPVFIERAGRRYGFYETGPERTRRFEDIDGECLVESHTFRNLDDAHAWAAEDARQRTVMLAAEGQVQ